MASKAYKFGKNNLVHAPSAACAQFVSDCHDPEDEIAALVASGDLFVTLATTLESTVEELVDSPAVTAALEHIIGNLLYLQRHYGVAPKQANYRQ